MIKKNFWFENSHKYFGRYFTIDKYFCKQYTKYQNIFIFENKILGKVMSINGIIQTTELDEFIYHEMMVHVPIITHGIVKTVLIIGDGDGGILRETSKYKMIEKITMIEIDYSVITCCKKYLSSHSSGSFNDNRLILVISDGSEFLENCSENYDIIILGGIHPNFIKKKLFSSRFYKKCSTHLNEGGIFVVHNDNVLFQRKEILGNYKNLTKYFSKVYLCQMYTAISYGKNSTFILASNKSLKKNLNKKTLAKRIAECNLSYKYYNMKMHIGSFFLPEYLVQGLYKI